MADHVGYEIASPKIEDSKHGTEHQRDDDVGPAARPMRNGKDEERNSSRPKAIQPERFQAFNGVAPVEQFFEHTGAQNAAALWLARRLCR